MTLVGLLHDGTWGFYVGAYQRSGYTSRDAAVDALHAELQLRRRLRVLGTWGTGPDRCLPDRPHVRYSDFTPKK